MSAIVMDGKALAAKVKARALAASGELARQPGLAVILVGEKSRLSGLCPRQGERLRRLRHRLL